MPHVILSGRYGNGRYGRGRLAGLGATATVPQPLQAPVAAQPAAATVPMTVPKTSPVQQMQAMFPTPPAPDAPPADATQLAPGILLDMQGGNLWYNGTRIAILSAVVSALVVKMIMFSGKHAGNLIRNRAGQIVGKKPDAA